jgi:hypothetical protein
MCRRRAIEVLFPDRLCIECHRRHLSTAESHDGVKVCQNLNLTLIYDEGKEADRMAKTIRKIAGTINKQPKKKK